MAPPLSDVPLELVERNDPDVALTLTRNDLPLDLTGATVHVFFKSSEDQEDNDPGNFEMVSPTNITIDNAAAGECTVHVPAANLPAKATRIWRVDVVDSGGKRHTCITGTLTVTGI